MNKLLRLRYTHPVPGDAMRIGELSRRSGVSPQLLRTWERRYGLLRPVRTPGGFRLYGPEDEDRVRRMRERIDAGFPAAAAARLVLAEPRRSAPPPGSAPAELRARLLEAALAYDEPAADALIDRVLAAFTLDTALGEVVVPLLSELGTRWERGEVTIAQEHFVTNLVRGRLLALARGWGDGAGPRALLACAPDEQHDLSLICFGLALRARGWRITFLGANTPVTTLAGAADALSPRLVVLAAVDPGRLRGLAGELAPLARRHPVALAGPGAGPALARDLGALLLHEPPTRAAARVAADLAAPGARG
jgi:DNA-binding transcriptional MerR regulator